MKNFYRHDVPINKKKTKNGNNKVNEGENETKLPNQIHSQNKKAKWKTALKGGHQPSIC